MNKEEFIKRLQRRIAQTSIGPSALRNQGSPGIINACRLYLENEINLNEFAIELNKGNFNKYIDNCTIQLLKKFPDNVKSWGAARKGLNLFFRDVVYNKYLSEYLNLSVDKENISMIHDLEVPLDSYVAKELIDQGYKLPHWRSIKKLSPEINKLYQDAAMQYANKLKINRLHLDLMFWRKNS